MPLHVHFPLARSSLVNPLGHLTHLVANPPSLIESLGHIEQPARPSARSTAPLPHPMHVRPMSASRVLFAQRKGRQVEPRRVTRSYATGQPVVPTTQLEWPVPVSRPSLGIGLGNSLPTHNMHRSALGEATRSSGHRVHVFAPDDATCPVGHGMQRAKE